MIMLREELGWCFVNKTLRLRRFWTAAPAFEDSRKRLVFMLNIDPTSGECYGLRMLIIASNTLILTLEDILWDSFCYVKKSLCYLSYVFLFYSQNK